MFWEYFDMIPPESKLKTAISDDPEYAKEAVESLGEEYLLSLAEEKDDDDKKISGEGYTRLNQQMDNMTDSIELLRSTVIGMFGGKKTKHKFVPVKRPTSAVQEELKRRIWEAERADNQDLFGKFGF